MIHNYLPDPENAIITALKKELGDVPVSTREPVPRPDSYVRLFLGSTLAPPTPIHEAFTFTVEAWHRNRESLANQLAMKVRGVVAGWGWEAGRALTDGGVTARILRTVAPRPVSYPSEDGWSRYTATYEITISHNNK